MNQEYEQYVREWDPEFRARSPQYAPGPVQNRPCQDICCLITFFVIVLSFFFLGVHYINLAPKAGSFERSFPIFRDGERIRDTNASFADLSLHPTQTLTAVLLMTVLSFVTSVGYILLLKAFPRCMIYTSIVVAFLLQLFLVVIAFASGHVGLGIFIILLMVLFGVILCCCCRGNIETTIILIRLTAKFLSENLCVLLTPVTVGALGLFMAVFALLSIDGVAAESARGHLSDGGSTGIALLHLFYYFFFLYFFYYVMVFLIASAAADWYFQRGDGGCCTGVARLLRAHIGSITFASIIITIVKIAQTAVDSAARDSDNLCAQICLCFVKCFLNMLEGLVHTLNHFGIIVMTYTGEGFVDSAKTAGVVILSNFELFTVLNSITGFIFMMGILFMTAIPTIVSIPLARSLGIIHDASVVAIIVFLVSLLISCIFLSALTESAMAIYVFYCFDRQLQQYGARSVPLQQYNLDSGQIMYGDFSQYPPNQLLTSAYPLISGVGGADVAAPPVPPPLSPPPAPGSNIYRASQEPIKPLYQPYSSGIKPNYESRDYNAPSTYKSPPSRSPVAYP